MHTIVYLSLPCSSFDPNSNPGKQQVQGHVTDETNASHYTFARRTRRSPDRITYALSVIVPRLHAAARVAVVPGPVRLQRRVRAPDRSLSLSLPSSPARRPMATTTSIERSAAGRSIHAQIDRNPTLFDLTRAEPTNLGSRSLSARKVCALGSCALIAAFFIRRSCPVKPLSLLVLLL